MSLATSVSGWCNVGVEGNPEAYREYAGEPATG